RNFHSGNQLNRSTTAGRVPEAIGLEENVGKILCNLPILAEVLRLEHAPAGNLEEELFTRVAHGALSSVGIELGEEVIGVESPAGFARGILGRESGTDARERRVLAIGWESGEYIHGDELGKEMLYQCAAKTRSRRMC